MSNVNFRVGINYAFLHLNYNPDYKGKQGYCLQGSGGCFGKDQLVITDKGSKPISEITTSDTVLSYNEKTRLKEWKKVTETHIHQNTKKCYRIQLRNGKIIKATEDHEFYFGETWIELRYYLILAYDIESFEEIEMSTTYDLTVEDNSNYYLDCGKPILVHNSGKTYDALFFILTYCRNNANRGKRIFICRETYSACKETVLADFIDILKEYGMYDKDLHQESHPQPFSWLHLNYSTYPLAVEDVRAHPK